jgi:flavorubredoxin
MPEAIIIYESRKGATEALAEAISEGLEQSGVKATLKGISEVDVAELSGYAGIILGSPTYHKDMVQSMKTFLFKLEQSNLKGKTGASFGAWGWSGEAVEMIAETMKNIFNMDVLVPPVKLSGTANAFGLGQHRDFGTKIAARIKAQTK